MKRGILVAIAALSLGGCVPGDFGHGFRESVDVTRPLAPDGQVKVHNVNGAIRVSTWDEPRVRIEAVKAAGSDEALRRLEVLIDGEGQRVEVRTRTPRGGFWFGPSGKVDYTITLPRGARASLSNVNGRIEASGVQGRLEASNVNGSVEADDLGGEVRASTVNGRVEVSMRRVDPAGRSQISATNGSVRLTLPANAAADLEASTVNGGVHCDFEVSDGKVSRRRVAARIGGGGGRFVLSTVNGSARIERGLATETTALADSRPAAEAGPESRR